MNSKKDSSNTLKKDQVHQQDHIDWNRRQFLSMGGMFAAGTLHLQKLPVKSMASPLLNDLINNPVNDNILSSHILDNGVLTMKRSDPI